MKQSGFMQRQKTTQSAMFHAGMECGQQMVMDYFTCVLHDPNIMGRDTFGKKRMERVILAVLDRMERYAGAYTDNPEADYHQDKLDEELREMWGDHMDPFPVRQPNIKITLTGKGKRC